MHWLNGLLAFLRDIGQNSELWAALTGSLVGGGATFAAVAWQTKTVFEHERKMARAAREEDRQDLRLSIQSGAASDLLDTLGILITRAERQSEMRLRTMGATLRNAAFEVGQLDHRFAVLLGHEFLDNWRDVRRLAVEVDKAFMHSGKETPRPDPAEVALAQAAARDLVDYAVKVQAQLLELINANEPVRRIEPPVLKNLPVHSP